MGLNEKSNIRLKKVYQRLNKPKYNSPDERKYYNLIGKYNSLDKWSTLIWSDLYRMGFVPNEVTGKEEFQPHFLDLEYIAKEISSISNKIDKILKKTGKTEDEIQREHTRLNAGRMSTSF